VTPPIPFALIGAPVAHSVSPAMYAAAFSLLRLPAVYWAVQVQQGDLHRVVASARLLGLGGFNVTVPHKSAIVPSLDALGETAALCGAVNTVVLRDAQAIGHNGDLIAVREAVRGRNISLRGASALVLGAGGAGRAAAFALGSLGAGVVVANRSARPAEQLVADLRGRGVSARSVGLDEASSASASAVVVVQATSVGLGDGDACVTEGLVFQPNQLCVEMIYRPLETRFMRAARGAGAGVVDGLELLVRQGCAALEWWWPEVEQPAELAAAMRKAAEGALS
jgi:shikimate dehydrogenase